MGNVNWTKTTSRYNEKSSLIRSNVSNTDWLGFMDALGWTETTDGNYCGFGGWHNAYVGIYQVGSNLLKSGAGNMNFYNGLGKELLGVTSPSALAKNPIAQELAGIMEFSGIPDIGTSFDSKYQATMKAFSKSNQLLGKTFTIQYKNTSGQIVGSDTVTFTQAGISAAAHLVGQGTIGNAMSKIYSDCFNSEGLQISSTATLSTVGFADGAGIAFTTYMKLMQGFDISSLTNAPDFNALVQELMTYRKDKIINYLIANKQEVAMSVSYGSDDYRETVRAIMTGLGLNTSNLDLVDGQVVLAGTSNKQYSDKSDLIFALDTSLSISKNVFTGGKGNDTIYGGFGDDTYIVRAGDEIDTIEDKSGNNTVVLCGKQLNFFYAVGNYFYNSDKSLKAEWQEGTGDLVVTYVDPITQVATKVILNENFQWGDFGINLITVPDNPTTENTILGDLKLVDFDPNTEGIQGQLDQWGNEITDSSQPEAGKVDFIYDTTGNDRIKAGGGDDSVNCYEGGANWISGGDGCDFLDGDNSSSCIIEGEAGSDIVFGGINGNSQLFGDSYGDMAMLIAEGETAEDSGVKGDVVAVYWGDNYLYGSDGYDIMWGGIGKDLIVAGGGNDLILGDGGSIAAYYGDNYNWSFTIDVSGDTYTPVITGLAGFEMNAPSGDDDVIYTGTGNDFVQAGGGDDEVYGGMGNDSIFGEAGYDFIEGGDGDDFLVGDNGDLLADSLNGGDYIDGGAGNDQIIGNGGDDELFGGADDDTIYGGDGDDYLDGEAGLNLLYGEAGNDVIFGDVNEDTLYGDDGDDYLDGQAGADSLYGGAGNDELFGGDNNDYM
ncbi:MAG: calcium-binding protein [Smithella sp.]